MSYTSEAPEEVKMPEGAVEFAIGKYLKAQRLLLVNYLFYVLLSIAARKIGWTEETAYEVGSLWNLYAFDYFCHNVYLF